MGDYSFSIYLLDHSAIVTGVRFGVNASYVTSCGMDRALKFYSS